MLKPVETAQFLGLNNTTDPVRLGLDWLTRADNVDIDDTGMIGRRDGFTPFVEAAVTGAYNTIDTERMYYVAGGALTTGDGVALATGLDSERMYWCEVNGDVLYNNGVDCGIVKADNTVLPWKWPMPATPAVAAVTGSLAPGLYRVCCTFVLPDGRETGASDPAEIELAAGQALQISNIPQMAGGRTRTYICPANSTVFGQAYGGALTAFTWDTSPDSLGVELTTELAWPLPAGATVIQEWRGRIYAAQYIPEHDMTALWRSLPLAWHLFRQEIDFDAISGEVLMLAPHDQGLIVGTGEAIYALTADGLVTLANFGVVPGCPWAIDYETPAHPVYVWTKRGMCRFPEFANLTRQVSVAPGVHAGAAVVHADGQTRFVVSLHQGGQPFNSRS